MKKAMLAIMFLAGSTLFAAPRVVVQFGFGAPAPVAVVRPYCPGPGYVWIEGYWAPNGVWVPGYWTPPVVYAPPPVYVGPYYAPHGHYYYEGHYHEGRHDEGRYHEGHEGHRDHR